MQLRVCTLIRPIITSLSSIQTWILILVAQSKTCLGILFSSAVLALALALLYPECCNSHEPGLLPRINMDIAASVVAFVGIAGQLLQGVSVVYTFLSDVQDAPEEIQQLNAELNLLKMILENMITYPQGICGSKEAFEGVGLAMEMVQSQVQKLKELVEKYNIKGVGRRKLVWSNINVAFRKKKFAKYASNLDRARKLLVMAQSSVES